MTLEELRRVAPTQLCPWCLRPHVSGVRRRRRCSACMVRMRPPWIDPLEAHHRAGFCSSCRAAPVPRVGAWRCAGCAEVERAKRAAVVADRVSRGYCGQCGRDEVVPGKRGCVACKIRGVA